LGIHVLAFEEDQLSPILDQWGGDRNKSAQRTHRTCCDDVELQTDFLSTRAHHGHIVQAESSDLLVQPGHPALHRLDERPLHLGTRDRQHQPWQPCTGSDVSDGSVEQGRGDHRVQDVPCPESRKFQRPDEPSELALRDERGRKLTCEIYAVTEEGCCDSGLSLDNGLRISHVSSWSDCISSRFARSMTGAGTGACISSRFARSMTGVQVRYTSSRIARSKTAVRS